MAACKSTDTCACQQASVPFETQNWPALHLYTALFIKGHAPDETGDPNAAKPPLAD